MENIRVVALGILVFYVFAWSLNGLLFAGFMMMFRHFARDRADGHSGSVELWGAWFSAVGSVALVMWTGWLSAGGRWSFMYMAIYTAVAVGMEIASYQDGRSDLSIMKGSLLGHGSNALLWGGVWVLSSEF